MFVKLYLENIPTDYRIQENCKMFRNSANGPQRVVFLIVIRDQKKKKTSIFCNN